MKAIFQDLRDAPRDQIDLLWEERAFTLLASNPQDGLLHVSDHVQAAPNCTWSIDGVPIHMSDIAEDVLTTTSHGDFADGAVLVQRILHTTVPEVQQQLSLHWKPRRLSETPIPDEDLSRITSFCIAFLPAGRFCLLKLSVAQWRRTLLRFKPKAAKGADGFALADLRNMNDQQVTFLLSLLTNMEEGTVSGPFNGWKALFLPSPSRPTPTCQDITDPSCCFL